MSRAYPVEAMTFAQALLCVRNGTVSFDAFALATATTWERYALYVARRWKGPVAVSREDLQQELLLAAWRAIDTWDPTRGKAINEYVVFMAIDKAKKWMHKQRNAKRRSDNTPGRFAVSFTAMGCETVADEEWLMPPDDTTPDTLLQQRDAFLKGAQQLQQLSAGLPDRDRIAVEAIVDCGGDLDAARDQIRAEPMTMLHMRITDTMVATAVRRAAQKLYLTHLNDGGVAQ